MIFTGLSLASDLDHKDLSPMFDSDPMALSLTFELVHMGLTLVHDLLHTDCLSLTMNAGFTNCVFFESHEFVV